MDDYNGGKLGASSTYEALDIVRFCHLFLRLYAAFMREHKRGVVGATGSVMCCSYAIQAAYTTLWPKLGRAVKGYWDAKDWTRAIVLNYWRVTTRAFTTAQETLREDRAMAAECLRLIEELDTPETRSMIALPMSQSPPPPSLFPETLISALKEFTEPGAAPSPSAPSPSPSHSKSSST